MLIQEKNLPDFVESPINNGLLQAKDRVAVTISRDFEDMGFFNVIVTPPAGYSWTFIPCVEPSRAFVCSLWNTSYKKRLATEKILLIILIDMIFRQKRCRLEYFMHFLHMETLTRKCL